MERRLDTISFVGTVSAGAEKTLVSQRIGTEFKTKQVLISFPDGQNRLVQFSVFISPDKRAPTTGKPTGLNIFESLGQVSYVVGNDEQKTLPVEKPYTSRGAYIKVYAKNNDGVQHTMDVQAIIEIIENATNNSPS